MKLKLSIAFVLAASLMAYGQGRPHGGMGQGAGMGQGVGVGEAPNMGSAASMGRDRGQGPMDRNGGKGGNQGGGMSQTQQPLKGAQINGGAFRMLEKKTGMTADQLKQLYATSGAKNFGQFCSAIVVSKNLNLDTEKVLAGLKTQSLGQTLQTLGVDKNAASTEIKKAKKQVKDAEDGKETA